MTAETNVEQFTWGKGNKKSENIANFAVKVGAVRIRSKEIAQLAEHLGYKMNSNSAGWMARKKWKWIRVGLKFGSIFVHPDHYTSDEREREIAKKQGYHDGPRHDFVKQFLLTHDE